MNGRAVIVAAAAVIVGIAAEALAFAPDRAAAWIPDIAIGWTWVGSGLIASTRRPDSRTGMLMVAMGFAWFLGNFAVVAFMPFAWLAGQLLFLHRGLLVHTLLTFPSGRIGSRFDQAVIVLGYAAAIATATASSPATDVAFALVVSGVAIRDFLKARGPLRRARVRVVAAMLTFAAVLVGTAIGHALFPAGDADWILLLAYEAALIALAVGMLVALVHPAWERGAVADLVIELSESRSGTLRDALARALGDPSLEIGYWHGPSAAFVGTSGHALALPEGGSGRAITRVFVADQPAAVLVHDPAVLDDQGLADSVAMVARLAAANARLQADVLGQVAEVRASRRRLLDAGDDERRRLERRIHEGPQQHLSVLSETLAQARGLAAQAGYQSSVHQIDDAQRVLDDATLDLGELARGMHPRILSEFGLATALGELADNSPVRVSVDAPAKRLREEIEEAVYFVAAEALTNVAKHANASRASLTVRQHQDRVSVNVTDDGIGGADLNLGSGLRGIADRVETLGGSLDLVSLRGSGTRLMAEMPLGRKPDRSGLEPPCVRVPSGTDV